jgi:hypothetical protein
MARGLLEGSEGGKRAAFRKEVARREVGAFLKLFGFFSREQKPEPFFHVNEPYLPRIPVLT